MPSITRRALLAGAGTAITAGSYGAYRLHRGATDATFDPWKPDPGTWPLPRYDHANTAHNPHASPPRETPTARRVASATTTARRPRFVPLVGDDRLVVYGSGLGVYPRAGGDPIRERDAPTPLAGVGPDGRLLTVERADADAPASLVAYAADLRETARIGLDADHPQGLVVGSREAYVGGQDGTLRAVDPESGRRWRVDGALPALGDGRLYAADAPLDGVVAYGERAGLDSRLTVGPKRLWSAGPTDGFPGRPAVADGRVVLGTVAEGGGVLAAVDADTGERLREPRALGRDVSTPAVVEDRGYVAVGRDEAGLVAAVDLSTGEQRWRDAVDWRASTPVVGGETLVVAGAVREGGERAGGVVRAYDAASGETLWTRGFDAGPTGLALVDDRVFVTVGADLYALR
jgi:outer membrane protein assembly factor BamB